MNDAYKYANSTTLRLDSFGLNMSIDPNVAILKQGRGHKWWLSARLLLCMSEQEADQVTTMGNGQLVQLSGNIRSGKLNDLKEMRDSWYEFLNVIENLPFDKTANDD